MNKVILLGLVSLLGLSSAEPPRYQPPARQTAFQPPPPPPAGAPYSPSGWRPQGARLALPQKSQPQQAYGPPAPAASYGPPPATTEDTIGESTEPPQIAKISSSSASSGGASGAGAAKPVFIVVPQSAPLVVAQPQVQSFVYQVQKAPQALVSVPQQAAVFAAPLAAQQIPAVPVSPFGKALYLPQSAPYVQVANNNW